MTSYKALLTAARLLQAKGGTIPDELNRDIIACGLSVKALWDYNNALTRLVMIYLNELRTQPLDKVGNFGIDFANAIEAGLNEAWRVGMRENDATEMTDEWQATVDEIIASERQHIPDFAAYLTEIALNAPTIGAAIMQAQNRLDLWIQRYEDVRNQAILASADEKTKMEWIFGDTDHCGTCEQLNGIVAYAREWDEAGLHPQGPPNNILECGGWKCQCRLEPTDKRHTRNALDRLLAIAGKQASV